MKQICTSNENKFQEFQEFALGAGMEIAPIWRDLEEIDADPVSVVVDKACQVEEGVLVEDTSLDIEGAEIGVRIRWNLNRLPQCVGKKATWTVLLAERRNDKVYVYRGQVSGKIVAARGTGFGFDPHFLPDGSITTLAQSKPERLNARAIAFQAFLKGTPFDERAVMTEWNGAFQA